MSQRSPIRYFLSALLLVSFLLLVTSNARAGMSDLACKLRPGLREMFADAGCTYPPSKLTMIALKEEMKLEVWSEDAAGNERLVAVYPILAASGTAGPKLRKGDRQVPEGVYRVEYLNPYSRFHLSMKLDYPNEFDRQMGRCDGRDCLGDDIFIHGNEVSSGCIAVGDAAIEELFVMVYDAGDTPVKVIIAPYDFRVRPRVMRTSSTTPSWLPRLYDAITSEMTPFGGKVYLSGTATATYH